MSTYQTIKEELLAVTKQSYNEQLFAGTSGNLSIYDRETGIMAITPSSVPYDTMTADDIVILKLDGEIIEGTNRPSSEWRMHAVIYKERDDVKAIVHAHSPYATSFSVSDETIPVILIEMVPFLGGDIKVARFGLPGTPEVGLEALKVLEDRNSCTLANHGTLAIGGSLAQAHIRAIYVEDAAKIYHFAKCNGNVQAVGEEFVEIMKNRTKKKA